jgi:hypothetical protein
MIEAEVGEPCWYIFAQDSVLLTSDIFKRMAYIKNSRLEC